jgi:gas vesicle protein
MSQQGNFAGGFLLGSVVGGLVGGVVGVLVASRLAQQEDPESETTLPGLDKQGKNPKKRQIGGSTEQNIEIARRGLEDKIAQLNDAIDDVRQQLSSVNGNLTDEEIERSTPKEF